MIDPLPLVNSFHSNALEWRALLLAMFAPGNHKLFTLVAIRSQN